MKNFANLMKQAKQMQENMKETEQRLAEMEIEGQAAGGLVKVTLSGRSEARAVKIDPKAVDTDDLETLEDLVMAAINDAQKKVQDVTQAEISKVTGGMSLPGMPGM